MVWLTGFRQQIREPSSLATGRSRPKHNPGESSGAHFLHRRRLLCSSWHSRTDVCRPQARLWRWRGGRGGTDCLGAGSGKDSHRRRNHWVGMKWDELRINSVGLSTLSGSIARRMVAVWKLSLYWRMGLKSVRN
jgi:hypothetical protein